MSKEIKELIACFEETGPELTVPEVLARLRVIESALAEQPAQQQQQGYSYDDLWNAIQRIETCAVSLPTFKVTHEGGLSAVVQNIVDAIAAAAALQPAQPEQEPVAFYVYEWQNKSDGAVFRSFRADERAMGRAPDRVIAVPAPPAQQKPLTVDKVDAILRKNGSRYADDSDIRMKNHGEWQRNYERSIFRAAEAALGIKD